MGLTEDGASCRINMEEIENAYPLSSVQKGMLYHCLKDEQHHTYVAHISFTLTGELDLPRWQEAWDQTCLRHDALRASFLWDGLDEPLQVINRQQKISWAFVDLQQQSVDEQATILATAADNKLRLGIDPAQPPLMQFLVHQLREDSWHVLWSIHHLIADGWSTPVILKDVLLAYSGQEADSNAPAYSNYIAWQTARDKSTAESWWRDYLHAAVATPLKLPVPAAATIDSSVLPAHAISVCEKILHQKKHAELRSYCQSKIITLSTLAHTVWAIIVAAYADTDDPVFGTTLSGRHPDLADSDAMVGMLLSTVPLKVKVNDSDSIESLLHSVQDTLNQANRFDSLPLTELEDMIDSSDKSSAFESIVVIESHDNTLQLKDQNKTLAVSDIEYATHSHYPLALLVYPGDSLHFKLVYDGRTVSSDSAARLLGQFTSLIDFAGNDKASDVASFRCRIASSQVPPEPLQQLPHKPLIHSWIAEIAALQPDSTAVVCSDESISYRQLESKSNQVANVILAAGKANGIGIGLYIKRSTSLIIGLLGILKSGNYYIPLDTGSPPARTAALIENAGIDTVLFCSNDGTPDSVIVSGITCLDIKNSDSQPESLIRTAKQQSDSLAYIMFTSGSTGTPKGVRISHGNLTYSTAARLAYYGDTACTFLLLSPAFFDSSVAGIYWSLCSGGTLVLPPAGDAKDINALAETIKAQRISHTLCLPSLYSIILEHAPTELLESLKTVVLAGEECRSSVARQHFNKLTDTALYNEYGPTEGTVWCTAYKLSATDVNTVPIGYGIPGCKISLVNDRGSLCPSGAIGEIAITSPGVSCGYLHKESNNSDDSPFSSTPGTDEYTYLTGDTGYFDKRNSLIYTGRKDRQVKIRGHRIEPAEIENAMCLVSGVEEAAVTKVVKNSNASDQEIIAALSALPSSQAEQLLQRAVDAAGSQ